MIVVSIDMWPLGLERAKYRMGNVIITNDGTGIITNDGTGGAANGAYDVVWEQLARDGSLDRTWQTRVESFARGNGVFTLLAQAFNGNTAC